MFSWVMLHKVTVFLIVVILFLLFKNTGVSRSVPMPMVAEYGSRGVMNSGPSFSTAPLAGVMKQDVMMETYDVGSMGQDARMVVQSSTMSLLVKNVTETKDAILQKTKELGGFMVNTSINNPQDAATATISIRIPAKELENALKTFRGLSIKVTNENIEGDDITDQYMDTEARLTTLLTTKSKFEDIFDKATDVQDILTVQREIINLQSQIDSIKGQQLYMERNTAMAHLTIFLSTDELALPYSPELSWRPELIVKQATRSLLSTVRNVGTLLIWVGVYAIIWVPLLIVFLVYKKRMRKTIPSVKTN